MIMIFIPTIVGGGLLVIAVAVDIFLLMNTRRYSPVLGVENVVTLYAPEMFMQREHAGVNTFKGVDDL